MTSEQANNDIGAALGRIPSGLFIFTACHGELRTGMLASWVQQAGFQPPTVSVSIARGRPIIQLVQDSHQFGLCQVPSDDNTLLRKFARAIEPDEDPFAELELVRGGKTSVPLLAAALAHLECKVATHVDFDGDHTLLIGKVVGGVTNSQEKPFVHVRNNGFKY